MNWFVYIAEARTGAFYVGITTDPAERVNKHNRGDGSRMAMQQGPFELRYVSKPFADKSGARTREAQIKGWSREKKQRLIRGEWS
ncbi:MAG: GIY-YIG nuclease family protein [Patescibacteria group bacterium]